MKANATGRPSLHNAAFGGLVLAEFLFFQGAVRGPASIYPRWYDQVQYLTEAYQGYLYGLLHGRLAAFCHAFVVLAPQGCLYRPASFLLFLLFGPSRGAALDVNMMAFLALQAAFFVSARRLAGSPAAGWMGVGLVAALHCASSGGSGSLFDFRLDGMSACAYGVALCVAVHACRFRSAKQAVLLGASIGLVLLTRFLTAAYFALIYAGLFAALLSSENRAKRLARWGLAALTTSAVAGPVLWINRKAIRDYYWAGQIAGPERALRESHLGPAASLLWVLRELAISDVGLLAIALGAAALASQRLLGRFPRLRAHSSAGEDPPPLGGPALVVLLFLLVPIAVLSALPTKAPQPVMVAAGPAVWLGLLAYCRSARSVRAGPAELLGIATALAGISAFLVLSLRNARPPGAAEDTRKVDALVDYIVYRAEECGLSPIRVAVAGNAEGLRPDALAVVGYERHRYWPPLEQMLPIGLFPAPPSAIQEQLENSDFVVLLPGNPLGWPFDREMEALLPRNRAWCERHLEHLGDVEVGGYRLAVYERKTLKPLPGGSAVRFRQVLAGVRETSGFSPIPPGGPVLELPSRVLVEAGETFALRLKAAYTPVRWKAAGLPPGLRLDGRSGIVRGKVARPGAFSIAVTAINAAGRAENSLIVDAGDRPFDGEMEAPSKAVAGSPIDVEFQAFDAGSRLDFIDVADLSERRLIGRLPAEAEGKQVWFGRYRMTFEAPGLHVLAFRFAIYDPHGGGYSFVDRTCDILVASRGGPAAPRRAEAAAPM